MEALLDGPFGRLALSAPVFVIGRAPANQLVLDDKKASAHHAEIRLLGQEGYSITDLGSTNGTFVNEQRLEQRVPRTLVNGEVIRIGDISFLYVVPEVQAVTPTVYAPLDRQGVPPTVYAQPGQEGVPPTTYPQSPDGQGVPPTVYAQAGSSAQYNNPLPSTVAAPPPQSMVAAPPPFTPYTPPLPLPLVPPLPASALAQPPKRNLLWLWITLGGVGLLVVAVFVVAMVNAAAPSPSKTLDAFCTAMKNSDYGTAYTEFSPSYQQRVPERYFVGVLTLGNVHFVSCTYGPISEDGDTATTTLAYQSANGKSGTDQVILTGDSNSDWKISYLQGLNQS